MDLKLSGRVALITGSSGGIGQIIAYRLSLEGAYVIIHGRNTEKINNVVQYIKNSTKKDCAREFCCDINYPNLEGLLNRLLSDIGHLDILVNNVGGVSGVRRFEDLTQNDWQHSFDLNFMSAVRFTNVCLPFLKKSDQARIINMATVPVKQPGRYNPHYLAAKAAMVAWSKYISNDFAPYGILVNSICPNTISAGAWHRDIIDRSEKFNLTIDEAKESLIKEVESKVPLRRIGTPEEVASLAVFLASSQSSFLTGTTISVDGGTTRSIL